MKKLTKILALVLSIVMVASCFVACSKDEKKDEPQKTTSTEVKKQKTKVELPADDEDDVEKLAETFFTTFQSGNLADLAEYFSDSDEAYESFMSEFDIDDLESMMDGAEEIGLTESDVENLLNKMFAKLFGELDYEIEKIKVDGNKATVDYTLSIPNYDEVDENSVDMDSVMMEIIGELEYSEEELSKMTEAELIEVMIEPMFDKMFDILIDSAKEAGTIEQDGTLIFEKIDGEWLITEDR